MYNNMMGGSEFDNTRRIKREEIPETIAHIEHVTGVYANELYPLGSAGKRPSSGDLDVAIDPTYWDQAEIHAILEEALGPNSVKANGNPLNPYTYAFPIEGNPRNGRVQLDLVFNDPEFLQFIKFDAGNLVSDYKSKVRTIILNCLAKRVLNTGDAVLRDRDLGPESLLKGKEKNTIIARAYWGINPNEGMYKMYKYRRRLSSRTKRVGYTKTEENIDPRELRKLYPQMKFRVDNRIITDPKQIVRKLFGKGVRPKDIESTEQLIALIHEKHPDLVKNGFFKDVRFLVKKTKDELPKDFGKLTNGKKTKLNTAPSRRSGKSTSLENAQLPALDTSYREFRKPQLNNKSEMIGAQLWAIRQEADSYRITKGIQGKELEEIVRKFKAYGEKGTPKYQTAEERVAEQIELLVKKQTKDNGYREVIDGYVDLNPQVDPTGPPDSNLRFAKPKEDIDQKRFTKMCEDGTARFTRKYDGQGVILIHQETGWEVYSLQMERKTDFYPQQIEALNRQTKFGVGSILKAESVIFTENNPEHENFVAMNDKFGAQTKASKAREFIESGELPEPAFIVYDAVFHNGKDLKDTTYDERCKLWTDLPVAHGNNGLLMSAEFYDSLNPDNWLEIVQTSKYEGWVVVDGNSTQGNKAYEFFKPKSYPRPHGGYKLKPMPTEDVVLYAVRYGWEGTGKDRKKVYESFLTRQRSPEAYTDTDREHPNPGEWIQSGSVSVTVKRENQEQVAKLVKAGKLAEFEKRSEGAKLPLDVAEGVVGVVKMMGRYPKSGKFRQPVFQGFRTDKTHGECIANILHDPEAIPEEAK